MSNEKLRAALKARLKLSEDMRNMGRPPHADYWVQSICEVEAQMREALAMPEETKPNPRRIAQAIAPFFTPGIAGHDSTALDRAVSAVMEAIGAPAPAVPRVEVCCQQFDTCRNQCVPLVDHLRGQIKELKSAPAVPQGKRYTVEPHGSGYAVYDGRDIWHHGLNLAHITETTLEVAKLIERGLNALAAPSTPVTLTRDEIDALIQRHVDPVATYPKLHNYAHGVIAALREKSQPQPDAPKSC